MIALRLDLTRQNSTERLLPNDTMLLQIERKNDEEEQPSTLGVNTSDKRL